MSKNAHSRSQKIDYRDVITQRHPEHQMAINKMILFLIVLTFTIIFLFAKI